MAENKIDEGRSWHGFGVCGVWVMIVYAVLTSLGIGIWCEYQKSRIADVAEKNANTTKWNRFWNMVDGKVALSDDSAGQFAKKLRRDIACDRAKKYAEGPLTTLFRKEGSYPGVKDTFGYLLLGEDNGGPFQPILMEKIEQYHQRGLQAVLLADPRGTFLLEDGVYVQRVKEWNSLWEGVAGKPVTFDSKGLALLAHDIRGYLHGKMGDLSWNWLVASTDGYSGLEAAMGNYDILTAKSESGEDWGEFTEGFASCVNGYEEKGLPEVLLALEPVPSLRPALPLGMGHLIPPQTAVSWLALWLLGSSIALALASCFEPARVADDEDLDDTFWRWIGTTVALPAIVVRTGCRLAWRTTVYGISRGTILAFVIREWRHPYCRQRATARKLIRQLTPLARHSGDASAQLERARETLSGYDKLLADAEARKAQDTLNELASGIKATEAAGEEVHRLGRES